MNDATDRTLLDRALAMLRDGDGARAQTILDDLFRRHPDSLEVRLVLGAGLLRAEDHARALDHFRFVATQVPSLLAAHFNAGLCLRALGRLPEALDAFHAALRSRPGDGRSLVHAIKTMVDLGEVEEAIRFHADAVAGLADPHFRPSLAIALLPDVPASKVDMDRARAAYESAMAWLGEPGAHVSLGDLLDVVPQFSAAYQGVANNIQQQQIAAYYAALCPQFKFTAPRPIAVREKLRIGFASAHLFNHTIGKLMRGLIRHLDPAQFETFVFSTRPATDEVGRDIAEHCACFVVLPRDLERAQNQIAQSGLDVLVYPDIGMDAFFYFLAFARLAPVQCVMWGHPVTTGIPAIDYFISGKDLESGDEAAAQALYSERLVRMASTPTYLYPVQTSRAELCPDLSFAAGRTIYACVQQPMKFHPDFDRALTEILRRDPNGVLVLLDIQPHLTQRLIARLTLADASVAARIHVLARLGQGAFFELLKESHVILDTTHFSGGLTSAEALTLGKVVVTLPHPMLMAGRVTYGYYRQMGVEDAIARDLDDYVAIAVRFGTDAEARARLEEKISARISRLLRQDGVVRDFEDFFQRAVLRV